jgi:hypothetical protein
MSAARNDFTKGLWSKPLLLAAALALLSGSASAQMPGSLAHHGAPQNEPSKVEQQRQKQVDNDYKTAAKNIPDQGPADPWGGVRPPPPVKGQSKNQSLTPYHRDSFNKQTPQ